MVTNSKDGFHRGDPVTFELSGMLYVGVFQECGRSNNAQVLVTEQGGRPTNLPMLVEVSSLRPLRDKVGVE